MTKPKSKLKAAARSTSRSTSKSRSRTRLAPSSSKTAMRPDTKHARILAMLRMPAGTTIAAIMTASEFDFRYSNRVALGVNDLERAERALKGIVGKRLKYKTAHH